MKKELIETGWKLAKEFCEVNRFPEPMLRVAEETWRIGACGYYRSNVINLCVPLCAAPGRAGRAWSWPGYAVDRTPYGVILHELGHHVDWRMGSIRGAYFSDYGQKMREKTAEDPLTTYAAENDAEWFAEAFRLFCTNPTLLQALRPLTFAEISRDFKPPRQFDGPFEALDVCGLGVPDRHRQAILNKIDQERRVTERARLRMRQAKLL